MSVLASANDASQTDQSVITERNVCCCATQTDPSQDYCMSSQTSQLTSEYDDVDSMSDSDSDWRHSAKDSCDDDYVGRSSVQFEITDCNPVLIQLTATETETAK